jgi:hypothetical protein
LFKGTPRAVPDIINHDFLPEARVLGGLAPVLAAWPALRAASSSSMSGWCLSPRPSVIFSFAREQIGEGAHQPRSTATTQSGRLRQLLTVVTSIW